MSKKQQKKLSTKHELFCLKYMKYWQNGTKAYQEVYWCEYDTARNNAARLLAKAYIKDYLGSFMQKEINSEKKDLFSVIETYKEIREYWKTLDEKTHRMLDAQSALKANDSLAKIDWIYEERLKIDGDIKINIVSYKDTDAWQS